MIMPNMIAPDKLVPIKPDKSAKKIGVAMKAPIKPSRVFPGLVFLRRILLPNFLPKKYAAESAKDTAIKTSINNFAYDSKIMIPETNEGKIIR